MRAYLDIETTFGGMISVIGLYRPDLGTIQLVGGGVCIRQLYDALDGVRELITYNGSTFDLPVIRRRLSADLKQGFVHCDLMYVCRRRGLRGGLKRVEEVVGIQRATAGLSGWDAPRLWHRYESMGDRDALETLLAYNREDVINLMFLEVRLGLIEQAVLCDAVRQVFG